MVTAGFRRDRFGLHVFHCPRTCKGHTFSAGPRHRITHTHTHAESVCIYMCSSYTMHSCAQGDATRGKRNHCSPRLFRAQNICARAFSVKISHQKKIVFKKFTVTCPPAQKWGKKKRHTRHTCNPIVIHRCIYDNVIYCRACIELPIYATCTLLHCRCVWRR